MTGMVDGGWIHRKRHTIDDDDDDRVSPRNRSRLGQHGGGGGRGGGRGGRGGGRTGGRGLEGGINFQDQDHNKTIVVTNSIYYRCWSCFPLRFELDQETRNNNDGDDSIIFLIQATHLFLRIELIYNIICACNNQYKDTAMNILFSGQEMDLIK